ncbi:hypothetical protein L6R53_18415, partial [Myxococcota bacterium]|nr:hypothetical protein [Myxococcota bacterium]
AGPGGDGGAAAFAHRGRAVAFGMALGLAMLTKWSTALFLAVPLAWAVGRVLWSSGPAAARAGGAGARAWGAAALVALSVGGSAAWVMWADSARAEALWWAALLALGWGPLGLAAILVSTGRRRSRIRDGGPAAPLANLALAGAAAASLTLPWFSWAAPAVREKVAMDAAWGRSWETNLQFVASFLHDCLPWAPLLLPLGALWALRNARARPPALALLVSLVGSALVLVASGHPKTRYLLGLVVYAAALAGGWVGDPGPRAGPSRLPRALPPGAGRAATAALGLAAAASLGAWLVLPGDAPVFRRATVAAPAGAQPAPSPGTRLALPIGRAPAQQRLELGEVITTLAAAEVDEVWGLVPRAALPAHLEDDELVEHLEIAALRAGVLFMPLVAPPLQPAPGGVQDELRAAFAFFLARTRAGPEAMVGLLLLRAAPPEEGPTAAELGAALPEGLVVVARQAVPVGEGRVAELWLAQVQAQLGQLGPGERAPFARQPMGAPPPAVGPASD